MAPKRAKETLVDPAFGARLRAYREEALVTQEELGLTAGVSARTIRDLEKGRPIASRTRAKVVAALNQLRLRRGHIEIRSCTEAGQTSLTRVKPTWLEFPDRVWLRQYHGPGALLTADFHVVPFHGTRSLAEVENLAAWCQDRNPHGIRIYKGEGGMGKTRLAVELCQRLASVESGPWATGFARLEEFPVASNPWSVLPELGRPLLVVVDYAGQEEKTCMIARMLVHLRDCPAPQVRLLLLERDDLWLDRLHANREAREVLLGPLLARSGDREVRSVSPVAGTVQERVDSFVLAARAFAEKLGLKTGRLAVPALNGGLYERVLFIHIQALLAVLGLEATGKAAILRHLLAREREYWQGRMECLGLSPVLLPAVEKAVCQMSLVNGTANASEAIRSLQTIPLLRDQPEAAVCQVARLLRECYPHGASGIGPLQPDLLRHYLASLHVDDPWTPAPH